MRVKRIHDEAKRIVVAVAFEPMSGAFECHRRKVLVFLAGGEQTAGVVAPGIDRWAHLFNRKRWLHLIVWRIDQMGVIFLSPNPVKTAKPRRN